MVCRIRCRGRCPHRRVSPTAISFPVRGKRYGRKGHYFSSETAITYLLKKRGDRHRPPLLPIWLSLPKDPVIVGDGGVGTLKFAACACGRKKPKCRLGLHFGKEETNLENKKHRFAMIRFGKVVSDAGIGPYAIPAGFCKKPDCKHGLRSGKEVHPIWVL